MHNKKPDITWSSEMSAVFTLMQPSCKSRDPFRITFDAFPFAVELWGTVYETLKPGLDTVNWSMRYCETGTFLE